MAEQTLTLREINRATLARQMLLSRERMKPLAAIEHLIALQAQWPRPPFVGLWTRLEGFERRQLAALFDARTVVRATFIRATIHVLSARDFIGLRPIVQPILEAAYEAILRERVAEWFDMDADSPYMLLVAPVSTAHRYDVPQNGARGLEKLKQIRSSVPAITHVDYSARVQTVDRESNPVYHRLLEKFFEATGCPVIVNTSFKYMRMGSSVLSPSLNAGVGEVGSATTSQRANAFAKSSIMSERTCCARR